MAASGVNIKMGVSGISQFKQNLNQAKSAVKTLDAQLALTEKQFKASGDAESYMAEKGELLKAKLEKQNQIVNSCQKALDEMTKNGVDRASKSYQDMYQQMINAKGAMLDTQTAMENIAGAADDADAAVSGMDDGLKKIGDGINIQNVTDALGSITSGMENVMHKAVDLGRRIVEATLGAGHWADELHTTATQWGLSDEELQRMQKTADIIDTDVSTIMQAKQRMNKGIGNELGEEELKSFGKALQMLGVDTTLDLDSWDNFWKIGEAIMGQGDDATKEAAAMQIFGKSWRELIPLFEAGREEYEKTNASWSVVSEEQIESLTKMDDAYKKLENEFETVKRQFEATIAEAITPVMETLVGLMQEFNKYLETPEGQKMLESLGDAVAGLFTDLSEIDPEQTLQDIVGIFDGIRDGLEWIKDNKDTVVTAIKAVVGAWVGLKAATSVATMLKLFNGLKGLFGGGNNPATTAGEAATAASGGWLTGAKNALTGAGAKATGIISSAGLMPAVLSDMFLNQTNAGRALRDGENFWEGISKDFREKKEEIDKNAEEFEGDWKDFYENNPIMKFFRGEYTNPYQPDTEAEADWRPSYMRDQTPALSHPALESEQSRPDTSQNLPNGMSYEEFKRLPKEIQAAIASSMAGISVYLDGQKVGEMVSPYVSEELAGAVLND
jgi:hypothetical protein